jgi:hypothetical protein
LCLFALALTCCETAAAVCQVLVCRSDNGTDRKYEVLHCETAAK